MDPLLSTAPHFVYKEDLPFLGFEYFYGLHMLFVCVCDVVFERYCVSEVYIASLD